MFHRDPFARSAILLVRILILTALVAALSTLVASASTAQVVDLAALKAQESALTREAESLAVAVERQGSENARLAENLSRPEAGAGVSFEDLRQAQFSVDIARTRLLTLDHRISQQRSRIDALNAAIVEASTTLRAAPPDTLRRVVEETRLEWLGRIRASAQQTLQRLEGYQALSADYLSLRQEELAIAQRMIGLDALEGLDPAVVDPIVERLRALVAELSQTALSLSNEAAAITEGNAAAVKRRNLLSLRADEALLRSNARLTDVDIVEARAMVEGMQPLLSEPAVPIRLFEEAIDAVTEQNAKLAQRIVLTTANREALEDFERVVGEPPQGDELSGALAARVKGLRVLLRTQLTEISDLRERLTDLRDRLARQQARLERDRLMEREIARTDRAARQRIAGELERLPGELGAIYGARLAEVRTALNVASTRRLVLFGLAVLAVLALTIFLRQSLVKRFVGADATRATEVPLEVVRRNLFWLFPVAVWAIFTAMFSIGEATTFAIYPLLVIPAAAASLRDLTQVIVSRRTSGAGRQIGVVITRATEVAMSLTALVVFTFVILNEVPLLPSTQSAINRLAYSVFVLSGLPMLLFVFFFAGSMGSSRTRMRNLVAAVLSLLPPIALIATGVTGLIGYTRLSALMFENLAVAIVIAASLALALGVLNDILEGFAARIRAEDPARAYFVSHNFLQPLYRASQIALIVVAVIVAWSIFDWTVETPVIREVIAFWRQPLFDVGDTTYRIGSVLIAAAALAFVFWAGAWSRRVAYTVVFSKLKDIGIRQSLSVFSQYVVIVVGVLLTLSAVGFDVTTLTVFAASLGVGIGFGLQNVVNNFISGLILLVERPLRLGDIVTVGTNSGTVSQIGIRSMRMRTFDEFDLMVPNSQLISDTFTNWTRTNSVMRVLITVGIGYDDDPEHAVDVVEDVLEAHKGVVRSPAPMVTVDEFGDSSVNLRVCYYVDLRGEISAFVIRSEVLSGIWHRFRAEGISIPFPQRDVHMVVPRHGPPAPASERVRKPRLREREDWVGDAVEMVESDDGGR